MDCATILHIGHQKDFSLLDLVVLWNLQHLGLQHLGSELTGNLGLACITNTENATTGSTTITSGFESQYARFQPPMYPNFGPDTVL